MEWDIRVEPRTSVSQLRSQSTRQGGYRRRPRVRLSSERVHIPKRFRGGYSSGRRSEYNGAYVGTSCWTIWLHTACGRPCGRFSMVADKQADVLERVSTALYFQISVSGCMSKRKRLSTVAGNETVNMLFKTIVGLKDTAPLLPRAFRGSLEAGCVPVVLTTKHAVPIDADSHSYICARRGHESARFRTLALDGTCHFSSVFGWNPRFQIQ